jgi:DNA-binding SARP family transcriptional activator
MFRNALREIRGIAPEIKSLILYNDGRYRLNPDAPLWVDTVKFYDILQQSSTSVDEEKKSGFFEEAVTLYKGPLLKGLYYTWVDDLRNALEERYIQALKSLAELYAKKGEHTRSANYCLKYLEIDVLDEGVHRLLMTNYIRLGRQSKALKHYEQLRRILRKELKSEPTPETASLFSSLR